MTDNQAEKDRLADRAAATRAEALREAAADFRVHAARAWGGDAAWMTTGARVAELVAEWLEEMAHG